VHQQELLQWTLNPNEGAQSFGTWFELWTNRRWLVWIGLRSHEGHLVCWDLGLGPGPTTSPDPSSRCHVTHATGLMSPPPVSRGSLEELSSEAIIAGDPKI
jgi:hypothetical protein